MAAPALGQMAHFTTPSGGFNSGMDILVLGGTQFVGKHIVLEALRRGHRVSIFTRGQKPDDLPAEVERLRGDRDGDHSALEGRTWDAAIDVSGYLPRVVRTSAELLKDAVGFYTFISTMSVYARHDVAPIAEDAPLAEMEDPTSEEIGKYYGALKVLCERVVEEVYGERCVQVRPTFVAGSYDPTDRFTYWVERAARGGEMLAPGDGSEPIQFVDARDLAAFTLHVTESRTPGAFNGCSDPLPFREFLTRAIAEVGSDATPTWVSSDFLKEHEIGWNELPMYVPGDSEMSGIMRGDNTRAKAAGFTQRPVEETVRDTLDWTSGRGDAPRRVGLPAEREREVLAAWHARQG